MENKEILEKEIDLIQNCITRMGQNSFSVKGWLIALIIAAIALLPENIDVKYICLIIEGISLIFWYLDAFYLKTERLYRWKYEWVIIIRLKTNKHSFNLNPYEQEMWISNNGSLPRKAPCVIRIMFTKTLMPFYLPIIFVALIILIKELLSLV